MSSTNKTSNYELSQFVGTDKPAWLADYNTDMSKIDAQMKLNADGVTTATGTATSASTAVGTLANLTTDAKSNLVSAVNEVDSHADSAQETASSALSSATGAGTAISNLVTYLTLSSTTAYTSSAQFQIVAGGGSFNSASISVSRNSAGTVGEIFGYITIANPSGGSSKVKLNVDTGLRPSAKLTLAGDGVVENLTSNNYLGALSIDVNTDGTIEFSCGIPAGATGYVIRPFRCLLFIENFNLS